MKQGPTRLLQLRFPQLCCDSIIRKSQSNLLQTFTPREIGQEHFYTFFSFYNNEHENYTIVDFQSHIPEMSSFPSSLSFTHGPCQKIIVQKFAAVAVQQLPKTILGRSRSNKKQGTGWKHVGKTFGWFRSFTNFESCSEGSFYFETAYVFSFVFPPGRGNRHLCHHGTTWRTCATKVRQLHLSAHRCEKSSAAPTGQFSHPESWDVMGHSQGFI